MAKWLSSTSVEKGWLESEREKEKKKTRKKISRKKRETFSTGKNVWEARILQEPHSRSLTEEKKWCQLTTSHRRRGVPFAQFGAGHTWERVSVASKWTLWSWRGSAGPAGQLASLTWQLSPDRGRGQDWAENPAQHGRRCAAAFWLPKHLSALSQETFLDPENLTSKVTLEVDRLIDFAECLHKGLDRWTSTLF